MKIKKYQGAPVALIHKTSHGESTVQAVVIPVGLARHRAPFAIGPQFRVKTSELS